VHHTASTKQKLAGMTAFEMLSKPATRWTEVMIHTKFVWCNSKHADKGVDKAAGELQRHIMEHNLLFKWGGKKVMPHQN